MLDGMLTSRNGYVWALHSTFTKDNGRQGNVDIIVCMFILCIHV